MSSNKLLDGKSISELQELFATTQQLLEQKQGEIRESAVQKIQQIALECVFQSKAATKSRRKLPLIPFQSCHRFR